MLTLIWAALSTASGCAAPVSKPESTISVASVEGYLVSDSTTHGGTAFFVENTSTVVTCWHVASNLDSMWINLGVHGGVEVESVVAEDELNDLIVLRLKHAVPQSRPLAVTGQIPSTREDLVHPAIPGKGF